MSAALEICAGGALHLAACLRRVDQGLAAGRSIPAGHEGVLPSQAPFNTPLDLMVKPAVEVARLHPEIVAGFEDISLRSYLYPRGSKLSWHDDRTEFSGALTYYIHPRWGSTWGGELMVA